MTTTSKPAGLEKDLETLLRPPDPFLRLAQEMAARTTADRSRDREARFARLEARVEELRQDLERVVDLLAGHRP